MAAPPAHDRSKKGRSLDALQSCAIIWWRWSGRECGADIKAIFLKRKLFGRPKLDFGRDVDERDAPVDNRR